MTLSPAFVQRPVAFGHWMGGMAQQHMERCQRLKRTPDMALLTYTIFVIMPTNRRLTGAPPVSATAETRRMLERSGVHHAGRSALGLAATLIFLWAQR